MLRCHMLRKILLLDHYHITLTWMSSHLKIRTHETGDILIGASKQSLKVPEVTHQASYSSMETFVTSENVARRHFYLNRFTDMRHCKIVIIVTCKIYGHSKFSLIQKNLRVIRRSMDEKICSCQL